MKRALDLVFGFRRDLTLSKRWWHRLFQVTFIAVSLAVIAFGLALFKTARYNLPTDKDSVRVVLTLKGYIDAHRTVANVVPGFLAEKGELGVEEASGDIRRPFYSNGQLEESFCSFEIKDHLPELVAFFNQQWKEDHRGENEEPYTVEQVRDWLKDGSVATRGCWTPESAEVKPGKEKVVKWEYRLSTHLKSWLKAAAASLGLWLVASLLLVNIYYRGFIYIIFGKRASPSPESIS